MSYSSSRACVLASELAEVMPHQPSPGAVFRRAVGLSAKSVVPSLHAGFRSLQISVRKEGSMKSLFFGGEGLVCEVTGKRTLWFQTRNAAVLGRFLHPFRRVKPKNNH